MSETTIFSSGLSATELEVLIALDELFMCASVNKIRAGYSSAVLVEGIYRACDELVRRGLAERNGASLGYRALWRRAAGAEPFLGTSNGHQRSPRTRTACLARKP